MTAAFELHPRLIADTFEVGRMALSRILLMNDARFPWVVMVPERAGAVEFLDLAPADYQQMCTEIHAVSLAVREVFRPDKLNVGAIGNLVPQLHVHVVGRFVGDSLWPRPVWGDIPAPPYEAKEAVKRSYDLRAALRIGMG